jgi:uncharacterized protein YndB with AHSA1/START domain
MNPPATDTVVRSSIVVEAPIEQAFSVFTEGIGTWFPPEYNVLGVDIAERVFEPRVGGDIYDRGVDGSECRWGRVLEYEPPNRLVFGWRLSPTYEVETDDEKTSEVEVRFTAEGPASTRLELEHRHLDRHGDAWEKVRESVGGEGGWGYCLQRFAARVAAAS